MPRDVLPGGLLDLLFPASYRSSPFPDLCKEAFEALADLMPSGDTPRVPGWTGAAGYKEFVERYGILPQGPIKDLRGLVRSLAQDALAGAVNWRCPELQYNLGAAVNVVAGVLYALALDVNVYLINDGLAGNAVAAERAVGRILAALAGADPDRAHGVFVFGGTGTIAYGIKAGLRKVAPASSCSGRPERVKVVITEDAHFSHATAADWLGIGSDDLVVVPADGERRSRMEDAERLLRAVLQSGDMIPTIIINGGTTYDHAVDDIPGWVRLRARLVEDYALPYVPHLHVDSVIGWAWLPFRGYDFDANPLRINPAALGLIRKQYERIRYLHLADSWGVDFHKGVGACPIDCSIVMFNDRTDLARLSRSRIPQSAIHQLAEEFSVESPVEYTLETSRAGGKAIAALASLHALGQDGYRALLTNLIENTLLLRQLTAAASDMIVLNPHALGYQTMIRLYPPAMSGDPKAGREMTDTGPEMAAFVERGNMYLKQFFSWDNGERMDVNAGGVVYSFSRKYVKAPSGVDLSGLKFYPTSPRISPWHVRQAVELLRERKRWFDELHWR